MALGHSSKCIFSCMVSAIMKRLVSFFMYDRVWFGARLGTKQEAKKQTDTMEENPFGVVSKLTPLLKLYSLAIVFMAEPT